MMQIEACGDRRVTNSSEFDADELFNEPLDDLQAIQEALNDIAAGDRGVSAKEFIEKLSNELGLPPS